MVWSIGELNVLRPSFVFIPLSNNWLVTNNIEHSLNLPSLYLFTLSKLLLIVPTYDFCAISSKPICCEPWFVLKSKAVSKPKSLLILDFHIKFVSNEPYSLTPCGLPNWPFFIPPQSLSDV